MPGSQKIFWNVCKIAFSNGLTVFYLHLEQPSDQENKNGFAAERLWFLEHRAASTLFRRARFHTGSVDTRQSESAAGKLNLLFSSRIHVY